MPEFLMQFEHIIGIVITIIVHILEIMGVVVIAVAAVKAFYATIKKRPDARLAFAQSMATGLEFKLAGEILHTVIVRTWHDIGVVAAIIVLRGILNYMITSEIKTEEAKHAKLEELESKG